MKMHFIMLVTPEIALHGQMPADVNFRENYGPKTIVDHNGALLAFGTSVMVEGESESVKEWLKPFDGLWMTTNPTIDQWQVFHVKD